MCCSVSSLTHVHTDAHNVINFTLLVLYLQVLPAPQQAAKLPALAAWASWRHLHPLSASRCPRDLERGLPAQDRINHFSPHASSKIAVSWIPLLLTQVRNKKSVNFSPCMKESQQARRLAPRVPRESPIRYCRPPLPLPVQQRPVT